MKNKYSVYLHMIFLVILLASMCLFMIGYKIAEMNFKKKDLQNVNPFINAHSTLIQRDEMYNAYVDWCYENKTPPLELFEFQSELRNNIQLREQIKKVMDS